MMNLRPHENITTHRSVFKHAPCNGLTDAAMLEAGAAPQATAGPTPDQLIGLSKRLYAMRTRRREFLSPDLFGEPGWDMLLALFNADGGGHKLTVSSLCAASQSPDTTALRWIERLIQLDLIERAKSPLDKRVFFVVLKPAGRTAISDCLRNIWVTLFSSTDRSKVV